eukprot:537634-Amorphochlora_amoeboformis.AAC.1
MGNYFDQRRPPPARPHTKNLALIRPNPLEPRRQPQFPLRYPQIGGSRDPRGPSGGVRRPRRSLHEMKDVGGENSQSIIGENERKGVKEKGRDEIVENTYE